MVEIRFIVCSIFCIIFSLFTLHITRAETTHSITGRLSEITTLKEQYIACLELLQDFAKNRMHYFEKGLGWKGTTNYGFDTGNKSVYFAETSAGITFYSATGTKTEQFSINYETETVWVDYRALTQDKSDRPRIGVGYKNNKPITLVILIEDGTEYIYWDKGYRVNYPQGKEYYYMCNYFRDEPLLVLSPHLGGSLFYGNNGPDRESVISDILMDFPYHYFSRIVKDAIKAKIDISNEKDLVMYTINWFRNLLSLSPIEFDKNLDLAAKNHAAYLIRNNVAQQMIAWDAQTINTNDYLSLHSETKGKPGFTGLSPTDRTVYTGFGSHTGECATIGRYDVINDELSFFHTIFHRRPFLDPRVYVCGHGHGVDNKNISVTSGITEWGYKYNTKNREFYCYPVNEEHNVPVAWSAIEAPNPFPEFIHGMGTPVTIAFTSPQYKNGNLELFDAQGKKVTCVRSAVLPSPDNFIEIVPEYPLKPDSRYTIIFTWEKLSHTSTFYTAPESPAETAINFLLKEVTIPVDLRDPKFDIEQAMKINDKKGICGEINRDQGTAIYNKKYDFSLIIPNGWKMEKGDWQDVLLKKSWYSINIYIARRGAQTSREKLYEDYSKNITYKEIKKEKVKTPFLQGYRGEYSWEYDNSVIIYYLQYNDYACIIYGYGALPEEIGGVFESFREGKP